MLLKNKTIEPETNEKEEEAKKKQKKMVTKATKISLLPTCMYEYAYAYYVCFSMCMCDFMNIFPNTHVHMVFLSAM